MPVQMNLLPFITHLQGEYQIEQALSILATLVPKVSMALHMH